MNDRELLQQALDALEVLTEGYDDNSVGIEIDAIEALRARLEQPEPEPTLNSLHCACGASWTFENGALRYEPKVEQEPVATLFGSLPVYDTPTQPVAWKHNYIDDVVIGHCPADIDRYPDRWTALYKDPTPCQTCEALARAVMMDQTSHDTPPQREWVNLTREEILEAVEQSNSTYIADIARAIEAKLKEKNT